MLQIIVFSFNRAIQLDTLLTSFLKHWKSGSFNLDIVYNTSNREYQEGYDLLIAKSERYKEVIHFYKEGGRISRPYSFSEIYGSLSNIKRYFTDPRIRTPRSNFRSLTIGLMEKSCAKEIMFLTDDAMFIQDVFLMPETIHWLRTSPNHRQFSLRLGKSMEKEPQSIRNDKNGLLFWNMQEAEHMTNWGYRFSVDAHIYNKNLIIDLFRRSLFVNPNTLEGYIEKQLYRRGQVEQAACFMAPKLLSYPINMVQDVAKNRSLGVDCRRMNRMYLDGYTLRYPVPEKIETFQVYPDHLFFIKGGCTKAIPIIQFQS